ncbi:MAG: hypothetical protein JXP34_05250 [Planctomycetes bacterium]|nr:hypothetical protein [Planctomycetota bacterium]
MATRMHDRHGGEEGPVRRDPQVTADIATGVAGLILIPLVFYFGAGMFVSSPPPEAPGLHVGGFAETKDLVLSYEAANAHLKRAEFLFRENYQNLFLDRFTRAAADLSDHGRTIRADLEWKWASAVLGKVKAIYTQVLQSIGKEGADPRFAGLRSTVEARLQDVEEETKKLQAQRIFIR